MVPVQALTALGHIVHAVYSGKKRMKSSWNQADDSFIEPHVEIASSLRSSQ